MMFNKRRLLAVILAVPMVISAIFFNFSVSATSDDNDIVLSASSVDVAATLDVCNSTISAIKKKCDTIETLGDDVVDRFEAAIKSLSLSKQLKLASLMAGLPITYLYEVRNDLVDSLDASVELIGSIDSLIEKMYSDYETLGIVPSTESVSTLKSKLASLDKQVVIIGNSVNELYGYVVKKESNLRKIFSSSLMNDSLNKLSVALKTFEEIKVDVETLHGAVNAL